MSVKVLIVDDSTTMRHQIQLTLNKAGYLTVEAADGTEGLERLDENPDAKLIFIDVNMPQMGGLEMLERIRENDDYANVACVILTTEVDKAKLERAKKFGAKGWIIKPFTPTQLLDVTKKLTGI